MTDPVYDNAPAVRRLPAAPGDPAARRELLAQVAEWYYVRQLGQAEIAGRIGLSRSRVSRMLSEARELGIVEIRIHPEGRLSADLGAELERRFNLRRAVVVSGDEDAELTELGRHAARIAEGGLEPSGVLAISYGTSVSETVRALTTHHFPSMRIVQMAGVEGARNPAVDGWDLVRMCAERFGARYYHLPAPLFVSSHELRRMLEHDRLIGATLGLAARADVAIVGIGSLAPDRSSLVRAGHLTTEQLAACTAKGSVGYICGRHFDGAGEPLDELNRLTLSLPLQRLREIELVVAVAGGRHKAAGIAGALRGGYVDVLVTDEPAATAVLE
jgi:deoxyribonucleoside regulator